MIDKEGGQVGRQVRMARQQLVAVGGLPRLHGLQVGGEDILQALVPLGRGDRMA